MRKSRTINLLLLGGSILSFSMCVCAGCGRHNQPAARAPYDPAWHDAQGNPIAKEWKTDEAGKRTPVQQPYDAAGKPIPFDENGNPVAPAGYYTTSSSSSHYHRTGGGWWPYIFAGRSSPSYGPTYRSGPTNTGGTYFGGSKPGSSSAPSSRPSGSSSSSGSVSRGGFGGSASHASGGSSS